MPFQMKHQRNNYSVVLIRGRLHPYKTHKPYEMELIPQAIAENWSIRIEHMTDKFIYQIKCGLSIVKNIFCVAESKRKTKFKLPLMIHPKLSTRNSIGRSKRTLNHLTQLNSKSNKIQTKLHSNE